MSLNRQWMYKRLIGGLYNPEFLRGVDQFIEFAKNHPEGRDGERLRCPCNRKKCRNVKFQDIHTVQEHLLRGGFVQGYHVWYLHGEKEVIDNIDQLEGIQNWDQTMNDSPVNVGAVNVGAFDEPGPSTSYHRMILEAAGPSFDPNDMEESPNSDAQKFYDMIASANQEVWPGCKTHSQLSAVARLLNIKAEHHLSERCFDDICQYVNEMIPSDNVMTKNFYHTKKLVRGMNMPVEKIHSCINACMIYWGEDSELIHCKFCSHPRYKPTRQRTNSKRKPFKQMYYFPLTPRLQRLYASEATAAHMRWHAEHEVEEGVMQHCSDAPAWKHFDMIHPSFAAECRNVRLGLCTDGFQPFGQTGQQYSSWPVIVTPYNLPPWMCMKESYMFLSIIVPGPKNPKQKLDVFLQPLISELKSLWEIGVNTYDISKKQNFTMRAALMWTISDFPAYSMLSGWSTAGRLACPYCMENTDAFTLTKGRKQSWFDNHRKFLPPDHPYRKNRNSFRKNKVVTSPPPPIRSGVDILKEIDELGLKKVTELGADIVNGKISKFSGWKKRSIFWDLPYWSTNLIRHNLDVMHIEKNFFENVFNTVLEVDLKTKDNAKSREDLKEFCRRPELHAVDGEYPKACYTLRDEAKKPFCEWVKNLKFPDGYVSNMGRCVDMSKHKLFGMKSHDCHVFMQRLVPIAFRELLPKKVWESLTEMSLFFRDLTSTVLREGDMTRLNQEIPEILCKLERIFPPSFFDSMEHLPVHLAYEAMIAGPVQYRWMYPFERNLRKLKNNVRNKARVEGSICNAYLVEEASSFCSHYFEPHVYTRHRKVPRNDDGGIGEQDKHDGNLSIFTYPGRAFGEQPSRYLSEEELDAAHIYILLNCEEVHPYIEMFVDFLRQNFPQITEMEVDKKLEEDFASWFKRYARVHIDNQFIKALVEGPLRTTKPYTGYVVNGFKFHTKGRSSSRASDNSGVCIKGTNYSADDNDYYGVITEILELEYKGTPIKKTVLFKCEWFDPTPNAGMKIHPQYKLVDINHKRRLKKYEPFVLEKQAAQVYYAAYPSVKRDKSDWWAVCKIKARGIVDMPSLSSQPPPEDVVDPFQFDEEGLTFDVVPDNEAIVLNDPNGESTRMRIEDDEAEPPNDSESNEDEDEDEDEVGDGDRGEDDDNDDEESYYASGSE